jgi:predicted transcriptional regulator
MIAKIRNAIMTDITFSVRIPQETKSMLDALSKSTQRSKNFLAREAITRFVQSEAEIVEGILQGLADVDEGRTVPHEDVVKTSRSIIAAAYGRKAKLK